MRYHLSNIPEVAAASWRLKVGGEAVDKPFELTLDNLKRDFEQVEIAAVNQCSGNRRGMFEPHVPGVEWGPGAMGNARWKGARLKDVLTKAGLKKDALEIVFDGADSGVFPATPDFVKSIPVWKAMDENTLIAWQMNGEPLPHWNGFPARIVVPGWTGTYWMKHVTSINAISKPFDGFWVKSAYRIPRGKFPLVDRFITQETDANTPITEMVVNSLMTNVANGQQVRRGPGRSRSRASRGTAATASRASKCRRTAARAGAPRRSAGLRPLLVPPVELCRSRPPRAAR